MWTGPSSQNDSFWLQNHFVRKANKKINKTKTETIKIFGPISWGSRIYRLYL